MGSPVSRLSRLIDLVSLVLIVAGAGVYLQAYHGMRELRDRPPEEFVRGETVAWGRLAEHRRLLRTSRVGIALAALGLIVGLSAAAHARQIAKRQRTQTRRDHDDVPQHQDAGQL